MKFCVIARIAVGHDHFSHRGAVADGSQGAVVVVGDLVQHEALAGVQRDAHLPLLPLQQVAVERERDAFGLDDVERLEVGARVRRGVLAVEAQRGGRDRHGGLFEHLQHLVVEQVDDGHDALNGPSVAVVVLGVAQVGDGLEDAVFGLPLVAEVAGRPGVDLDRLELLVGDALALHRGAPRGVVLDGLLGAPELLHQREGLDVVARRPRFDGVAAEVDDGFMGVAVGGVVGDQEGAALDRVTGGVAAHDRLVGLVQRDEREADGGLSAGVSRGKGRGSRDFVAGKRVKRVSGSDRGISQNFGDHVGSSSGW